MKNKTYNNFINKTLTSVKTLALGVILFISVGIANAQTYPAIDASANCAGCAPTGWNIASQTPDMIAGNGTHPGGAGYVVSGISGTSPQGGRMALLLTNNTNTVREALSTNISGLTVGSIYDAAFYVQGAQDASGSNIYSGGSLVVQIGTNQSSFLLPTASALTDDWQLFKVRFTATAATMSLSLTADVAGASSTGACIVVDGGGVGSVSLVLPPPTVNANVSNNCPTTTVNLNTQAHTGTIPSNNTLVWFRDIAHTDQVVNPTAVTAGTYYAFYQSNSDSSNYSQPSQPVTVTITTCCAAGNTGPNIN